MHDFDIAPQSQDCLLKSRKENYYTHKYIVKYMYFHLKKKDNGIKSNKNIIKLIS